MYRTKSSLVNDDKSSPILRLLGLAGLIGAVLFIALNLALYRLDPAVSILRDYVSDYANGPSGRLFQAVVVLHGLANIGIALGFAVVIRGFTNTRTATLLLGAAATGIIMGGLFPSDPPGVVATVTGRAHVFIVAASFLLELAAIAFFARAFRGASVRGSLLAVTKLVALLGGLALLWLAAAIAWRVVPGLAERFAFAAFLLWEISASVFLILQKTAPYRRISPT